MAFETHAYTLPNFWISAIEYDDRTAMTDDDEKSFESFMVQFESDHGPIKDTTYGEDMGFMRYHDAEPHGVLACNCTSMDFLVGCPDNQD